MIDRTGIINSLEREIKRIRKEPKSKMLGIFMTVDEAEDIVTLLKENEAIPVDTGHLDNVLTVNER